MGRNNYFKPGDWNLICDLCGDKIKAGESMKTWDNFRVCAKHKEVRNPQDFVRGIKDDQTVPFSRPEQTPQYVLYCTLQGTNAIPGYAVPGCAIPSYVNLAFLPSVQPPTS